jgi:hypothetical protein
MTTIIWNGEWRREGVVKWAPFESLGGTEFHLVRKAYGHLAFELSNLDTTTSSHRNKRSSGSIEG